MKPGEVFVRWDSELQHAFVRLGEREGMSRGARLLDMQELQFRDLRQGKSRGGGKLTVRKFLSTETLGKIALALEEPELEDREALTRGQWVKRGLWPCVDVRRRWEKAA